MLIVGLTGNYGMGKSTVLRMFRELGAVTIETDEIVDALLRDKTVLSRIKEVFGEKVIAGDGYLDRKEVAAAVFRNKKLRDILEDIIHPLVFEKIQGFLEDRKRRGGDDKVAIIEIPLLFERDYAGKFQRTVAVFTSQEVALKRLEVAGISREDALMRLEAQMPAEEKARKADFAINNNGLLGEAEVQVEALYRKFLEDLEGERCRGED